MIKVDILRVQKSNFINYCYVVSNLLDKAVILVDPAWQFDLIQQTIISQQLKPIAILLTHHHYDHVNLAATFGDYYNIPVYMGEDEIKFYDFKCPKLFSIKEERKINLNSISIQPILTPGHTYGGICYWIGENLFTGDTLFNEGCGICIGKGADPCQMFNSLIRLKQVIEPHIKIYPGHCFGLPVGQYFKTVHSINFYLQFDNAQDFVKFRMRQVKNWLFQFQ